jgi:hypothetical protein
MSNKIVKAYSGPEWLFKAVNKAAHQAEVSRSEWVCRAIMDALIKQKIDPSDFTEGK